ncbi:MAG: SRPBCC domain-containing protein [Mycobacteriales bacterium]
MSHEFEVREEIVLAASPDQVWDAIATGPGVDSWFIGRNEIEPGVGGTARNNCAGFEMESTITAWEPGKRLAMRSEPGPDGAFMAFEYLIEARDGGSTVLRFAHSGILTGDWSDEYDALKVGDRIYLENLALYLKYFPGRTATVSLFVPGPQVADADAAWSAFRRAFGLPEAGGEVSTGDTGRIAIDGIAPTDATVEIVHHPSFLGARTRDALYLLVHGYENSIVAQVYGFAEDADEGAVESALQAWLGHAFPAPDEPADEATDREFTLTNTFDASREEVFAAWTEPARLAEWFGPRGFTTPADRIALSLRPGGAWRAVLVGPDGTEAVLHGTYREIAGPDRLVFTTGDPDNTAGESGSVATVTLHDRGGRTEMVFRQAGVNTTEAHLNAARAGWVQFFERLADHLSRH